MNATDLILQRAGIRRGKRTGMVEMSRCVLDLAPGDRVAWLDGSRTIGTIEETDDGTTHIVVHFVDAFMRPLLPCARYHRGGVVQVIELTAEEPAELAA